MLVVPVIFAGFLIARQQAPASASDYVLGPDDQIVIKALDVEEFDGRTVQIDMQGYVDVPLVGHVKAAGQTATGLEKAISEELKRYVQTPRVTVTVAAFKSRPVSVVGAVTESGTYPLNGQNTLVEVLSQAKGLTTEAGDSIRITREKAWGPIPLPNCADDATGRFYTASVNTMLLMRARDPSANIKMKPGDVVSVPKAEMIYVVGAVNKAGAFVLSQRTSVSVLQALSMAEGLEKTAAGGRARIIHQGPNNEKKEIPTDLNKILSGNSSDVQLVANDILFVPNSGAKTVGYRAMEAAVQAATGVLIYRP
jgi:polysaccharide biosynthesis/export protein